LIKLQSSESESDIDERTDLEKEFFELVENGSTNAVQKFLRNNRTIDVNKRDKEVLMHKLKPWFKLKNLFKTYRNYILKGVQRFA